VCVCVCVCVHCIHLAQGKKRWINCYKDGTELSYLTRFIDRLELLKSYISTCGECWYALIVVYLGIRVAKIGQLHTRGKITQYPLSRKLSNYNAWFRRLEKETKYYVLVGNGIRISELSRS